MAKLQVLNPETEEHEGNLIFIDDESLSQFLWYQRENLPGSDLTYTEEDQLGVLIFRLRAPETNEIIKMWRVEV